MFSSNKRDEYHYSFRFNPLARLVVAGAILFTIFACADTGCDCVTPLDQPLPKESRVYDAMQLRFTPELFDFLDTNLPALLKSVTGEQLTFPLDPFQVQGCTPVIGTPCFTITVCPDGCEIATDIVTADITPTPENIINMDLDLLITGVIPMVGTMELGGGGFDILSCDFNLNMPKELPVQLIGHVDDQDHLLYFEIPDLQSNLVDSNLLVYC